MRVSGSVGAVWGTSRGMDYHRSIWLKNNAGAGQAEIEGLI